MSITIHNLVEEAISKTPDKDQLYLRQYPAMIRFFRKQEEIDADTFHVMAMAVYGWMPTILKHVDGNHADNQRNAIICINSLIGSKNDNLTVDQYESLVRCLNNSYIGASKFLHFINPDIFPIWDSRVARYLKDKQVPEIKGAINSYGAYLKYKDWINNLVKQDGVEKAVDFCNTLYRYETQDFMVTKLRAIEQCLFICGGKR